MKKIIVLFICGIQSCCFALIPQQLLSHSKQLIIVSTPHWDSINGQMQRFERDSTAHAWKALGKPFPVVIGKHGMGWDFHFKNKKDQSVLKHEGDGLTPMGIYPVGATFGFAAKSNNKTNYLSLTDNTICVDDVKSTYYNKIINSATVSRKDWNSGEQMRQVPQYKLGAIVQYNTTPTIPGAGSCIFMHIWKSQTSGTAGCIAMEESKLKENLNWLDTRKNPIIAIFTMRVYKKVKLDWKLPRTF